MTINEIIEDLKEMDESCLRASMRSLLKIQKQYKEHKDYDLDPSGMSMDKALERFFDVH